MIISPLGSCLVYWCCLGLGSDQTVRDVIELQSGQMGDLSRSHLNPSSTPSPLPSLASMSAMLGGGANGSGPGGASGSNFRNLLTQLILPQVSQQLQAAVANASSGANNNSSSSASSNSSSSPSLSGLGGGANGGAGAGDLSLSMLMDLVNITGGGLGVLPELSLSGPGAGSVASNLSGGADMSALGLPSLGSLGALGALSGASGANTPRLNELLRASASGDQGAPQVVVLNGNDLLRSRQKGTRALTVEPLYRSDQLQPGLRVRISMNARKVMLKAMGTEPFHLSPWKGYMENTTNQPGVIEEIDQQAQMALGLSLSLLLSLTPSIYIIYRDICDMVCMDGCICLFI